MTKLSKETVLPLAAAMMGNDYTEEMKRAMESFDWSESNYYNPSTPKAPMTKKQVKVRNKNKAARKARKKNRKLFLEHYKKITREVYDFVMGYYAELIKS